MKTKLFIAFLMVSFSSGLFAQSDLTLYNFNAIPQSLHVNPAQPQQTKVWVGLPALSGVHFHLHNSGFALIDIIATDTDINDELAALADALDDDSHLAINQSIELLGIGFKVGKGFVTLGANQQVDFHMTYPAEVLKFISWQPGDAITGFTLNDFELESTVRTNFYVGYQHKLLNDKLTLGTRVKYIFGQQNSFIDRINVGVDATDPYVLKIRTNTLIRASGLANLTADGAFDNPVSLALPDNTGFAFDFGFDYKLNKRWSFSGSVLDLGSINWSDGNEDYVSNGEYDFEGIELDFSEDDFSDVANDAADSLIAAFEFDTVPGGAYSRSLNPRFFVGANYHLNEKHALGVLYHGRTWNGELYSDYSVNYQGKWFRGMQFIASYSVINGTTNNVGAGVDFKLGPVQLYLISDNVLGAIMYENLQTANIRVGLNLTFYGRKDKNKTEKIESPVEAPVEDEAEETQEENN